MKDSFLVRCITKDGKEMAIGNGEPMTEQQVDRFARAHRGGVGESVGNRYVVRPILKGTE